MDEPRNLDSIPYDVLYQIASRLDCYDYINLSRVNRTLYSLTRSEPIARKIVENGLLHTKEGQKAHKNKSGYRQAVGHSFDIKEAVATAQPYSAAVLGYGTDFVYGEGRLCYVHDSEIRVLDVHSAGRTEQVLNICNIISRAIPGCVPEDDTPALTLLNYSEGILVFLVEIEERAESWLLAMDLQKRPSNSRTGRLRLRTQLESTQKLFVCHNRSYLYYGTNSSIGVHGHSQWVINCVDLETGQHLNKEPVELDHFPANELGQTVCFGVHQDHLYAVSTLTNYEPQEVDWTSFYVWYCISPDGRKHQQTPNRFWRRQHREGPIFDTWTDLVLQHDEATKQLLILECRREWRDGGSDHCRTYYRQSLPSPREAFKGKQRDQDPGGTMPIELPDEPLTKTLDSFNKPNYERPRKRLRRNYHSEHPLGTDPADRHDFILAKTKYRTYNLSASTFIDIVNDPRSDDDERVPHDRLRLRMVSRKRRCPIDVEGEDVEPGMLYPPEMQDGEAIEYSEARFVSRGVHFWPPDHAPRELDKLLCPSKRAGKVRAMADERTMVYWVDQPLLGGGKKALILVNFDPRIQLSGLRRLNVSGMSLAQELGEINVGMEHPRIGEVKQEGHFILNTAAGRTANHNVPSVREESAMYLRINRGYWLR